MKDNHFKLGSIQGIVSIARVLNLRSLAIPITQSPFSISSHCSKKECRLPSLITLVISSPSSSSMSSMLSDFHLHFYYIVIAFIDGRILFLHAR